MILAFAVVLVLLRVFYSLAEMVFERDWPRSTWRGLVLSLALLGLCASAFGQSSPARVDVPIQTSGPNVPSSGGPLPQTLWVANSTVALCIHPQSTYAGCVANPLQTYTDLTLGSTCPTATPLVQLPGNTCTADTGTTANIGFWYNSTLGSVDYYVVSSYGTYGPFTITSGGGGGGGSVPAGLNGAATYYQGTPGGGTTTTVGAGPGFFSIPGIVNNNTLQSTDNCDIISNALALGGQYLLPNNLQGSLGYIACANTLQMPISGNELAGKGWGTAAPGFGTTQVNYLGSGWAIQNNFGAVNGGTISIHDLNVNCTTSATGGIQLTGGTPTINTGNFFDLYNLSIRNCASALNTVSQGIGQIRNSQIYGTTNTVGYVIEIGNGSTGDQNQNSLRFSGLRGDCVNSGDQASTIVPVANLGFLRVQQGLGVIVDVGDVDGCNGVLALGDFADNGYVVSGFDATITHSEVTRGPQIFVDQNSSGTFNNLESSGADLYLGPAIQLMANAKLNVISSAAFGERMSPLLSTTVNTTGGSLSAGTYCLGVQATNTTATIPGTSTTVSWQNGVSPGICNTIASGTTNSITINWPFVTNATSFNIVEGPTITLTAANIVNTSTSGISGRTAGTYIYTGTETVGATPAVGNIPWISTGQKAYVCVTNTTSLVTDAFPTYAATAIDYKGTYYTPGSCLSEDTLANAPTAGSSTNATYNHGLQRLFTVPSGTANSSDELMVSVGSTDGSGNLSYVWQNLFKPNVLPLVNTTASGTQINIVDPGTGAGQATITVNETNSAATDYPMFLENLNPTGNILKIQDSSGTWGLYTSQEIFPHNFFIQSNVASVSGTNHSSPLEQLNGTAWVTGSSTSQSVGWSIQSQINNTATTPNNVLSIQPTAGPGLTPVSSVNIAAPLTATGLTDTAISAGTSPICANGTGGAFTTSGCSSGGSGLSGMTATQVPIAATATTVTSSMPIQGTDASLLSSGTVSGTGSTLCTDANGGATTSGCSSGSSGLSGMTAGQVAVAATASTVTSSFPINGAGAGLVSGPTLSVNADIAVFSGTTGSIVDGALAAGSLVTLTGTQTLTNKTLTSPTMTTPALGTPSGGVATNLTGLPLTTGVTGTLPVANGGTGTASTLTGLVRGSASAMTAAEISGDCTTSGSNSITCTKTNGTALTGYATAVFVADTTFTNATTAIGGNVCSASAVTVTMTGVTTGSTFSITPSTDASGSVGWGSTGGLVIDAWPTLNTLNYKICNQTAGSITPGALTWNVSAR